MTSRHDGGLSSMVFPDGRNYADVNVFVEMASSSRPYSVRRSASFVDQRCGGEEVDTKVTGRQQRAPNALYAVAVAHCAGCSSCAFRCVLVLG